MDISRVQIRRNKFRIKGGGDACGGSRTSGFGNMLWARKLIIDNEAGGPMAVEVFVKSAPIAGCPD